MTDTLTITNPIPTTNGGEGGGSGTASGIFYINVVRDETATYPLTLDKTWNEIKTVIDNGMLPVLILNVSTNEEVMNYALFIVQQVASNFGGYDYCVSAFMDPSNPSNPTTFMSTDPDGVLHVPGAN